MVRANERANGRPSGLVLDTWLIWPTVHHHVSPGVGNGRKGGREKGCMGRSKEGGNLRPEIRKEEGREEGRKG